MPSNDTTKCSNYYGCIHVRVGDEMNTARILKHVFPAVDTYAICQMKHKSQKGVRSCKACVMVPGYILFCADKDERVSQFLTIRSVYHILTYDDNTWQLRGDDLMVARWIIENDGMIGVSKLYCEGDDIRIIDGPLKKIEGRICRIDKRNRNALVSFGIFEQTFKVWLAFEYLESTKVNRSKLSILSSACPDSWGVANVL